MPFLFSWSYDWGACVMIKASISSHLAGPRRCHRQERAICGEWYRLPWKRRTSTNLIWNIYRAYQRYRLNKNQEKQNIKLCVFRYLSSVICPLSHKTYEINIHGQLMMQDWWGICPLHFFCDSQNSSTKTYGCLQLINNFAIGQSWHYRSIPLTPFFVKV